VSAATRVLIEHAYRGARIQRILRLLLGLFFVAVLILQPPDRHLAVCWLLVICYGLWSIAVGALIRVGGVRSLRYAWLALFVDVITVAALTLIADTSAARTWAPYLLIKGFFLVPVIAAAQLNPWICAVVAAPAVLVYLLSSFAIRNVDDEPISSILLRTGLLATVGLGCVLLSHVQRSRVSTIARLLDERTDLLAEMVTIEQREQRNLAETLHDGARCSTCLPLARSWRLLTRRIRTLPNASTTPWLRPPDSTRHHDAASSGRSRHRRSAARIAGSGRDRERSRPALGGAANPRLGRQPPYPDR